MFILIDMDSLDVSFIQKTRFHFDILRNGLMYRLIIEYIIEMPKTVKIFVLKNWDDD